MKTFAFTLVFVLICFIARSQDYGWRTIYSEGSSVIEYRIVVHHVTYLNDTGNGWKTKVFCRSNLPDDYVQIDIVADVTDPDASYNGRAKTGASIFSGYCGANNKGINDKSNDYETFSNVRLDYLRIGNRQVFRDGRQVGR